MLKINDVEVKRKNILIKQQEIEFSNNNINVIKGKNGTGKTTLLEMLYFGKLILLINEEKIDVPSNYISFLSQYDYMINDITIKSVIELLNLENDAFKFMEELNIPIDKVCKTLSGGEKQKVRIMAAIFDEKNIIILDEPFNNIDKNSVLIIKKYIESMDSKCFIITNHHAIISFKNEKVYEVIDKKLVYNKLENKKSNYKKVTRDKKLNYLFYKSRCIYITALILLITGSFYMFSTIEFEQKEYFYDNNVVIYYDETNTNSENQAVNIPQNNNYLMQSDNIYIQIMQNPKSTIEEIIMPTDGSNIEYIESGEYPSDYSNEILIDNEVAKILFPELKSEEIIGQKIIYNDSEFIISGIYVPMNKEKNIVYKSYNEKTMNSNYYICTKNCEEYKENGIYNDHSFENNKVTYLFIIITLIITITIFLMLFNVFLQSTRKYRKFIKYYGFKNISYTFEIVTTILFSILIVLFLVLII